MEYDASSILEHAQLSPIKSTKKPGIIGCRASSFAHTVRSRMPPNALLQSGQGRAACENPVQVGHRSQVHLQAVGQ